jgi:hypothetical protein
MKAKASEELGPRTFPILFNNISKTMAAICKHYFKIFMFFVAVALAVVVIAYVF